MREASVEHTVVVAGRKYVDKVPAMVCSKCDEELVRGDDLGHIELKAAVSIANSGEVSGETFRFMRKTLGLTAVELGALLDTKPETISRWENGKVPTDRSAWLTLGSLVVAKLEGRSDAMERLKKAASGKVSRAKIVHLDRERVA
jgi:DNA-binding transcriptional regulator YiaG